MEFISFVNTITTPPVSLDKLQLAPYTVTQLFRDGLTKLTKEDSTEALEKVVSNEGPVPIRFLGEHQKRVMILVDYPSVSFIPDGPLQFLTKILEACKMNLADVAICNTSDPAFLFNNFQKELQPRYVILFGIDPLAIGLPMNFGSYKAQDFNGMTFLQATTLDIMNQVHAEGKAQKLLLWNSLKQLFSI